MSVKIITIGVYGFTEEAFFRALHTARVDTLCDLRQRRNVRGSAYAFANSERLQRQLAALGIRYLHHKDLAPTTAIRQHQEAADKANKIAKRQRTTLSQAFVAAYRQEILAAFRPQSWLEALPSEAQIVALFCVEREPAACHRSLVVERLQQEFGLEVEHIGPG
jgi:uncharacterized protein (DUF488 family)